MKTEFNVERVCERVHLCIVDAPDELGAAKIEVRNGSIHVSFPGPVWVREEIKSVPEADQSKPKRRGKNAQG